jgi:polysaccharide export outer membrane protein
MRRLAVIFCAILLAADVAGAAFAARGGSSDAAPAADGSPAYVLSSGDKLKITVFNVASLSGEYAISPAGEIALPLIGDVKAAGKTVDALSDMIRGELANGFVNDPKVTIEILDYAPYYILGEVNKPGQFPYVSNLTVEQAVATAGGST